MRLSGITPRAILYMDNSLNFPFLTVYQVLDYYQHNKRGRMKSVNLLEEEHGSRGHGIDLKWEMCWFAIDRALKFCTAQQVQVFRLRYCTEYPDELSKGEIIQAIASRFGKKKSTVYAWLDEIIEDIEREAVDLRLIPQKKWH